MEVRRRLSGSQTLRAVHHEVIVSWYAMEDLSRIRNRTKSRKLPRKVSRRCGPRSRSAYSPVHRGMYAPTTARRRTETGRRKMVEEPRPARGPPKGIADGRPRSDGPERLPASSDRGSSRWSCAPKILTGLGVRARPYRARAAREDAKMRKGTDFTRGGPHEVQWLRRTSAGAISNYES